MTTRKERLTITVDPELVEAGNQAVAAGLADSLSGWVNAALAQQAMHDRRIQALAEAVTSYESEFGTITDAEIAAVERADREAAVVVRGKAGRRTETTAKRPAPRRSGRGSA